MVPWDMVPIGQIEEKPDEFQPLVNKLKSMKYTISLGVRDGWLLLGTGESTAEIARLGGPGKHLADLPEFKLLSKAGGQKLTSVGYGSKALMSRIVKASMDFQGSFKQLQQAIPPDALTAEQRKKLGQLLQGLVKDFQGLQTEPGAIFGFSFLTGRGYESYQYNWSKNPLLDGSKPLSLIQHLGGNPLLALVIRQKASPDLFELFVKWIRTAYDFASEVAVPKLPEKEKKEFEKWSGALKPLVERLFEVTGKMLLPSLADGQKAIVLDAKWTSKQWFKDQPLSERPLPMLQLGLLLGVSDAAQFRKAIENYRAIIGEGIGKIHELSGKEGPAPKIPKPQTREEDGIQLRWWPLPEKWGLDKQVAPTAGLSENVAVLAVSQECAQRLLKETPLKGDSKLLANIGERPLVGLAYCNWPGVVNALTPWIEYGIRQKAKNETMEDQKVKAILDQVHTVSNVLKTFRGVVALMYLEDGALVEHSEAVFRDLPPLERVKAKPVKPKADNP
jgi:hypothetical protein